MNGLRAPCTDGRLVWTTLAVRLVPPHWGRRPGDLNMSNSDGTDRADRWLRDDGANGPCIGNVTASLLLVIGDPLGAGRAHPAEARPRREARLLVPSTAPWPRSAWDAPAVAPSSPGATTPRPRSARPTPSPERPWPT